MKEAQTKRCIFIDRDGVICKEKTTPYVRTPGQFVFIPGCAKAIAAFHDSGFYVIVITNQSGINRGIIKKENFKKIQNKMTEALKNEGSPLDAVFVCPHTPDEKCACRKPQTGNILKAAKKFKIDLPSSYFIGDTFTDLEAGKKAGCSTVLVLTGKGKSELKKHAGNNNGIKPDFIAKNLLEAARQIQATGCRVQGAGKTKKRDENKILSGVYGCARKAVPCGWRRGSGRKKSWHIA